MAINNIHVKDNETIGPYYTKVVYTGFFSITWLGLSKESEDKSPAIQHTGDIA